MKEKTKRYMNGFINMKGIGTGVMAAAMWMLSLSVSSCGDDIPAGAGQGANPGGEVRIDASIGDGWNQLSRSSSYITDIDRGQFIAGDKIGVFGYYLPSGTDAIAGEPDFMNNQLMTFNGSAWDYSPVKYWPDNTGDKLAFWAYYPHNLADMVPSYNAETGQPQLIFNNTPLYSDVMVADVVTSGKNAVDGTVPLAFRHILAKVNLVVTFAPYLDEEGNPSADIQAPTLKMQDIAYHEMPTAGKFNGFDSDGVPLWSDIKSATANGTPVNWIDITTYEISAGEEVFINKDYTMFMPFWVDEISFVPLIVAPEGTTVNHRYADDDGVGNFDEENFQKRVPLIGDDSDAESPDEFNIHLSRRFGDGKGVYAAPGTETTIKLVIGLYGIDNVQYSQRPIAMWSGAGDDITTNAEF